MKDIKTIAVVGGGNGGHAMCAYLSSLGFHIRWWMGNNSDVEEISKTNQIKSVGFLEGTFQIEMVSSDMEQVLMGSKIILVVLPANIHKKIALMIAPFLKGGETIILNPGRTAGALNVHNIIKNYNNMPDIFVGETQSLIFTCRKISNGYVDIMKIKSFGQIAFLRGIVPDEIKLFLGKTFSQMIIEPSTLVTGIANIGAILHPAPVIFNIGRIEAKGNNFLHYYEGITPTISEFLEEMDEERRQIAVKYNVKFSSVLEWHKACYGLSGKNLYDTLHLNERYASLRAPTNLEHRYLYEDITTGLVPLKALAEVAGVGAKHIETVINLSELVLKYDFENQGRNLAELGLTKMTIEEIMGQF